MSSKIKASKGRDYQRDSQILLTERSTLNHKSTLEKEKFRKEDRLLPILSRTLAGNQRSQRGSKDRILTIFWNAGSRRKHLGIISNYTRTNLQTTLNFWPNRSKNAPKQADKIKETISKPSKLVKSKKKSLVFLTVLPSPTKSTSMSCEAPPPRKSSWNFSNKSMKMEPALNLQTMQNRPTQSCKRFMFRPREYFAPIERRSSCGNRKNPS